MTLVGGTFPFNAVIVSAGISILMGMYIVSRAPNKSIRLNIVEFLVFLMYGYLNLMLAQLDSKSKNLSAKMFSVQKKLYYSSGTAIVGFCSLICCLVLINGFITIFQSVFYLKRKAGKQESRKPKLDKELEIQVEDMMENANINGRDTKHKKGLYSDGKIFSHNRIPSQSTNKFLVSNNNNKSVFSTNL